MLQSDAEYFKLATWDSPFLKSDLVCIQEKPNGIWSQHQLWCDL